MSGGEQESPERSGMNEEHETVDGEEVEETPPGANLPAVREHEAIVTRAELSVPEVVAQKDKITDVMREVMTDGVHYGKIPGINKPTLLKPGAEAINVALRLAPHYQSEKDYHGQHLTVTTMCELRHIPTGLVVGTGEGLCTTFESKYRYRQGKRTCPACGADAIVRSTRKSAYFCISNEGGCGNRYGFGSSEARQLDEQDVGRVENEDLADSWNTVVKMAAKRALVAATLNATAASDVFTQDVEDQASAREDEPAAEAETEPTGPQLLPNAVKVTNAQTARDLRELQARFAADLEWGQIEETLAVERFGAGRDALDRAQTGEFWVRLANAVELTYSVLEAPELGALNEQIARGYGDAFELEPERVMEILTLHTIPREEDAEAEQQTLDEEAAQAAERDE